MRHNLKMILACLIPTAILLALYFFGISNRLTSFGTIALMIIAHLWMMKEHSEKHMKGGT